MVSCPKCPFARPCRSQSYIFPLNISNETEQHTNDHFEYIPQRRTSNDKVRRVVVTYPTHQRNTLLGIPRPSPGPGHSQSVASRGQSLRVISSKVSSLSAVCCCCCCCDPFKLRLRGISQALGPSDTPGCPYQPTFLRERENQK